MTNIYKRSGVIFFGYGVTAIGMFLVGPSQMLGLIDSEKITMVGLSIMGFGAAMIIIPVMPDMIDVAEQKYPHMEKDILKNKISGLFISSQGIGEALGPILGSVFQKVVGFRLSQDIVALVLLSFMILYYLMCGRRSLFDRVEGTVDDAKAHLTPLLEEGKQIQN
jgi:MFS family permease